MCKIANLLNGINSYLNMEQTQIEKEKAHEDGKRGFLYPESHQYHEDNRRAYDNYATMRISPIWTKNLDDLLR